MRRLYILLAFCALYTSVSADPTGTYYSSIDGLKGDALKTRLKAVVNNHSYIDYGQLDDNYPSIYTITDRGTEYVYDIFSKNYYTYANGGFNKEHVVPKSWWGGHTTLDCYHDIISVVPANAEANSKKNNFPPGTVKSAYYDNGRLRVGTPTNGLGTEFQSVFEPADEFKGDFARIYMYVATCYDDAPWAEDGTSSEFRTETWPTMSEWLYKLLLKWHNDDPVSDTERTMNDRVQRVQGNRNPFVDYPTLADYIWGDWRGMTFSLDDQNLYVHSNIDYPGTLTGSSTERNICLSQTTFACHSVLVGSTVTKTFTVRLTDMNREVSIAPTTGTVSPSTIAAGTAEAMVTWTYTPTTTGNFDDTVTLTAGSASAAVRIYGTVYDPNEEQDDGTEWELVTSANDLEVGDEYLLVCRSTGSVASTLTGGYMPRVTTSKLEASTTRFTGTPEGAQLLTLGMKGNYFTFAREDGKLLGSNSNSSPSLSFGNSSASQTWTISINNSTKDVTIANTTDNCGTMYYNSNAQRFKTYTSTGQMLPQLFHKVGEAVSYSLTWMVGDETYYTSTAFFGQPLVQPTVSPSAEGYTFMGWTTAENISSDGAGITFLGTDETVKGDATYHAVFALQHTSDEGTAQTLLDDDFSSITSGDNTSTGGSNAAWSGDSTFPTVNSAYKAGGVVKIGNSRGAGSITSVPLNADAGKEVEVTFDVKGWTSVEGKIVVTVGSESQTVTYEAVMSSSEFENKSVTFTLTDDNPSLTLASTAKRAFIDNVRVSTVANTIYYSDYTLYPTATMPLVGDVNEDGEVNVSDVTALVAHILGNAEYDVTLCDLNEDGEVNVSDVTALVALILNNE